MLSKNRLYTNRTLLVAVLMALSAGVALFIALQNLLVAFAVAVGLFLLLYAPARTWIKSAAGNDRYVIL